MYIALHVLLSVEQWLFPGKTFMNLHPLKLAAGAEDVSLQRASPTACSTSGVHCE